MSTIVEQRRFSLTNIGGGNNKFWNITLYDDGAVEVHFGPQGKAGQKKTFHPPHPKSGRSGFLSQIQDKTSSRHEGGAYTENKVLDAVAALSSSSLKQCAVAEIAKGHNTLTDLVSYLTDVNIHNIDAASGGQIKYDTQSGLFRTTQGVISLEQIHRARQLLNKIAGFAAAQTYTGQDFLSTVNSYLSLIPQAGVVRKMNLNHMFGLEHGLRRQGDMLDALEASYATVINTGVQSSSSPSVFKVDLSLLSDSDAEAREIREFYHHTKGGHADVQSLDVKQVFALRIHTMSVNFLKVGVKLGNVMRLWHGTKASNVLSILKSGMQVPPASSPHVTYRLFGDGIYFSDMSTKSIRYATGAWGSGGSVNRIFMFVCDVAMGNVYYTPTSTRRIPAGYDSCWAKAGISTQGGRRLLNNEMIVYNVGQANPVFLVEFER